MLQICTIQDFSSKQRDQAVFLNHQLLNINLENHGKIEENM